MRIRQTSAATKAQGKPNLDLFENPNAKVYLEAMQKEISRVPSATERWTKRIGGAAILFFLIKGILWLIVPAIVAYFALK